MLSKGDRGPLCKADIAFDFGYGLYADGVRVASFAEGHVGYREWVRKNGRLGDIHSLDDRYGHDVDELMG
jgi:hypothetical protein